MRRFLDRLFPARRKLKVIDRMHRPRSVGRGRFVCAAEGHPHPCATRRALGL